MPIFWVSKWVDYSDKYGLGYQLCDNSVGVLFNDCSRLLLGSDGEWVYARGKCIGYFCDLIIFYPTKELAVHPQGPSWRFPCLKLLPGVFVQESYSAEVLPELHVRAFTQGQLHINTDCHCALILSLSLSLLPSLPLSLPLSPFLHRQEAQWERRRSMRGYVCHICDFGPELDQL